MTELKTAKYKNWEKEAGYGENSHVSPTLGPFIEPETGGREVVEYFKKKKKKKKKKDDPDTYNVLEEELEKPEELEFQGTFVGV